MSGRFKQSKFLVVSVFLALSVILCTACGPGDDDPRVGDPADGDNSRQGDEDQPVDGDSDKDRDIADTDADTHTDGDTTPDGDTDTEDDTAPVQGPEYIGSGEIGADGGLIHSDERMLTLSFPPGALTESITITVETLHSSELPDFEPLSAAYHHGYAVHPEGLDLARPASIGWQAAMRPNLGDGAVFTHARMLLTYDGQGWSVPPKMRMEVDVDENINILRGTIDRLQPILAIHPTAIFDLSVSALPDSGSGGDVPFNIVYTASDHRAGRDDQNFASTADTSLRPLVNMRLVELADGSTPEDNGESMLKQWEGEYRCDGSGAGRLGLRAVFSDRLILPERTGSEIVLWPVELFKTVDCLSD